jgi:hypothetical protein
MVENQRPRRERISRRSLVPLLDGDPPVEWRHGFLVERYGRTRPDQWGAPGPVLMAATPDGREALAHEEGDAIAGVAPIDSPPYLALRTERYLYGEYASGERELYDMQTDPYQLQNLVATADPALLAALAASLDAPRLCAGADCRAAADTLLSVAAGG